MSGARDPQSIVAAWRAERHAIAGAMGLAGLARHAGALADAFATEAEASAAERGRPVSCRKGCAACCREAVPLSPPEVCLLAESLAELPRESRQKAEGGFRRGTEALRRAEMESTSLFHHADRYFSLRIDCPFLFGDACIVHVSRPSACREHLVVSDSRLCAGFPSASILPAALPVSVSEALSRVSGELLGAVEMIPLVRAPEWLAEHSDLPARRWEGAVLLDRLASACLARLD